MRNFIWLALLLVICLFSILPTSVQAESTIHIVNVVKANSEEDAEKSINGWPFNESSVFDGLFDGLFSHRFRVEMDGGQEVPGPGDIDGLGEAKVKIKTKKHELCVDIESTYIDKITAAHIHHAPKGSAGAVVVSLPVPNQEGEIDGCVELDPQLLKKINNNPQDYYVNIHTEAYSNGAIRGQLF